MSNHNVNDVTGDQSAGGEAGKYLALHNWKNTPLGVAEKWPANLKSCVGICLTTAAPVAVWWGRDLVFVCNNSFLDLIGRTYADVFGKKGSEIGTGLWKSLEPVLTKCLTGSATRFDHFQNERGINRQITLFNSPVYDTAGKVSGVFTTVGKSEVGAKAVNDQTIPTGAEFFKIAVELTDVGTWDYDPQSGVFSCSERCRQIYGIPADDKMDFGTFAARVHPADRHMVDAEILNSMRFPDSGKYAVEYRILRSTDGHVRWIKAQGKVFFNAAHKAERFIGTLLDVTDERLRASKQEEYELKMRLTMQASAIGSFEWDIVKSDFKFSSRLAEIFGYSTSENLTQANFSQRIHPADSQSRLTAHETAFKTGLLFYESRVVLPDESIRWIRVNGYTIFDEERKPQRMYGTVLDITDSKLQANLLEQKVKEKSSLLKRKTGELKLSEERYHKMTDEVQDYAIILLDEDGNIVNWNVGASKIKGYTEEEIKGKNFSIFYLDEDRRNNLPETLIGQAKKYGRAMHEGWRKRKDGSKFWGSIVITALHNDRGDIIGFTKVTRDLTERKIAEDTIRQHATELEIKNQQLEQFAYIASHDLQEPLRKIQTFVQVLETKIDIPDQRQKYVSKIYSSAKRMGDLIQSVLHYSRLSQTSAHRVPTDLNEILENVKLDFELLIEEKNAVIKSDNLPSIPGIPLQLGQLFTNLIGNALKFTENEPCIAITTKRISGGEADVPQGMLNNTKVYTCLTFKDNGIGFDQQYAERIFSIFQRLNSRDEYAGTGIGLALCKKIVENHDGYIEARSSMGAGAEFLVYLPVD